MCTKRRIHARPSCQIQPAVFSGSLVVGGCDRSSKRLLQAASRLGQEVTAKLRLLRERRTPQEGQHSLPNWMLLLHGSFSLLSFVVGKLLLMVTVLSCCASCCQTPLSLLTWLGYPMGNGNPGGSRVFSTCEGLPHPGPSHFLSQLLCHVTVQTVISHQMEAAQPVSHDESYDESHDQGTDQRSFHFISRFKASVVLCSVFNTSNMIINEQTDEKKTKKTLSTTLELPTTLLHYPWRFKWKELRESQMFSKETQPLPPPPPPPCSPHPWEGKLSVRGATQPPVLILHSHFRGSGSIKGNKSQLEWVGGLVGVVGEGRDAAREEVVPRRLSSSCEVFGFRSELRKFAEQQIFFFFLYNQWLRNSR